MSGDGESGRKAGLLRRVMNKAVGEAISAVPALGRAWAEGFEAEGDLVDGPIPWSPPRKALAESRVALITTGGLHLHDQVPFVMSDADGDPSYRTLPADVEWGQVTITHDYYNHRDVAKDPNIMMPRDRVLELVRSGHVGALHDELVSFMGHIDGRHVDTLRAQVAPELANRLVSAEVDLALLTPA